MSIQAMVWAIKSRVGDSSLKLLLILLANYADDDGKCWPSLDRLAADSECSRRTIQRSLNRLVELGFIRIEKRFDQAGRQTSSLFYLGRGEGDTVSPPLDTALSGGRVTQLCPGEGDTTVSTLNEPSLNPKKEPSLRMWADEAFDRFWVEKPNRDGANPKKPAKQKFLALCKSGKDPMVIIAAATRLRKHYEARRETGTRYVPQMITWLNQHRFEDDPPPDHPPNGDWMLRMAAGQESLFK